MTLNAGQASALELRLAELIEKHDTPESRVGSELVNSLFLLLQQSDDKLIQNFDFKKLAQIDIEKTSETNLALATIRANVAVIMKQLTDESEFTDFLNKIDRLVYEKEIELVKITDITVLKDDIPKLDEVAVHIEPNTLSQHFSDGLDKVLTTQSLEEQLKELTSIDVDTFIASQVPTEKPSDEVKNGLNNSLGKEIGSNDVDNIGAVNRYALEQAGDGAVTLYYISHPSSGQSKLKKFTYSSGSSVNNIADLISPTNSYEGTNSGFESSKPMLLVRAAKDRSKKMESDLLGLTENSVFSDNDIAKYERSFKTAGTLLQLSEKQGNENGFNAESFSSTLHATMQTYIHIINTKQTRKMFYIQGKHEIFTADYHYLKIDANDIIRDSLNRGHIAKIPDDNPSLVFLRKHYETKLIQEAKAKVESLELEVANLTEESVSKMRPQELQYNIQKVLSRGREIREDLKLIQSDGLGEIDEVKTLLGNFRGENCMRTYLINVIQELNQNYNKGWFSIENKEDNSQIPKLKFIEVSNSYNNPNTYAYMDNVLDKSDNSGKDQDSYLHHLKVLAIKGYEDLAEQYTLINEQLSGLVAQENKESTPEDLSVLAKNILSLKNNIATLKKVALKTEMTGLSVYAETMEEQLSHTLQVILDLHAKQGIASVDFQNLSWRVTVPYLSVDSSGRIVDESVDIKKESKAGDTQRKIKETGQRSTQLSPQVQLFFLGHKYTHLGSQITAMLASVEGMEGKEFSSQVAFLETLQDQEGIATKTLQSFREGNDQYETFDIDHKEYYQASEEAIQKIIVTGMNTLLATYNQELSAYLKYGEHNIEDIPQEIESSVKDLKNEEERVNACIMYFNKQGYPETPKISGADQLLTIIQKNIQELRHIGDLEKNMNSIATKEADIDKISDYELDKKKYTGLSNILATAKGKTYTNTTAEPRRTVLIKSIEQALLPISQRIQEKNEHIKQALDARDLFQSVDLKNNEKYGVSRKYLDTDVSSVYENQRDKYLLRVREEKKQELILAAETDENIQHAIQLLNVYMEESEIVTLEVLRDRGIGEGNGFDALIARFKNKNSGYLDDDFDKNVSCIKDHLESLENIDTQSFSERPLVELFLEEDAGEFLTDKRLKDIPRDSVATYLSEHMGTKYFKENNSRVLSTTMTEGVEDYLGDMPNMQVLYSSTTSQYTKDKEIFFTTLEEKITELEADKATITFAEIQTMIQYTIEYIGAHSMKSYSFVNGYITDPLEYDYYMDRLKQLVEEDEYVGEHKDNLLKQIASIKSKMDQLVSESKIVDLGNVRDYTSIVEVSKACERVIDESEFKLILEEIGFSKKAKSLCLHALEGTSPDVSGMMQALYGSEDFSETEREKILLLMSTYLADYYQQVQKISSDDTNDSEDAIATESVLTAAKNLLEKIDTLSDSTGAEDPKVYIESKLRNMTDEKKIVDIHTKTPTIFSIIRENVTNAKDNFETNIGNIYTTLQEQKNELTRIQNLQKSYDEFIQSGSTSNLRYAYDIAKNNNYSNTTLDKHFKGKIYFAANAIKALADAGVSPALAKDIQKKESEIQRSVTKIHNLLDPFNTVYLTDNGNDRSAIDGLEGSISRVGDSSALGERPQRVDIENIKDITLKAMQVFVNNKTLSMLSYIESLEKSTKTALQSEKISAYKKLQEDYTLVSKSLIAALEDMLVA